MHFPWFYHATGLASGIISAIAYLTLGRLATYYESRVIVLSFLVVGVLLPSISLLIHYSFNIPADGIFIIDWKWPAGIEWFIVFFMGTAALFGQYFVTKAYGSDKAGIVSIFGYSNIIYSVFIGMLLGDAFPDLMSWAGITCIIISGIIISLFKRSQLPDD
jgi:drug/metabolite transporter (DMT)-like permease